MNGLSGYKLVLNFVTGKGHRFHFCREPYRPVRLHTIERSGFEIRAVQSQAEATAQAPPQGTAIEDVLDFQVYPSTGFQATDAFFAIDPSFTFPPEHLTDHFFLEVPSTLSTGGGVFDPLTTQISDFVVGARVGHPDFGYLSVPNGAHTSGPPEAPLTYTNIDIPGASSSIASNINGSGQIVGAYVDSLGTQHAYVTDNHGGFTTFDFPGAVSTFGWESMTGAMWSAAIKIRLALLMDFYSATAI